MKIEPINIVSKIINFARALRKLHAHTILTIFNTITLGAISQFVNDKRCQKKKRKIIPFYRSLRRGQRNIPIRAGKLKSYHRHAENHQQDNIGCFYQYRQSQVQKVFHHFSVVQSLIVS